MKIGYFVNAYPEQRCIINKCNHANYVFLNRKKSVIYVLKRIANKLHFIGLADTFSLLKFNSKNVDVISTINTVLETKNKWCPIYESTIPRNNLTINRDWERGDSVFLNRLTDKQISLLAQENCLSIIAMSNSAHNIQKNMLEELKVDDVRKNKILDKMLVLYPPQQELVSVEQIKDRYANVDILNIIFVGRLFFRKGGAQIIDVLSQYVGKEKFKLTLISTLDYGDNASRTSIEDYKKYKEIIENSEWIDYYESLPNSEVLDKCKNAHVGLLPTFADTFGFSVLEMQACGVPVITTDIRALPEINNNECGYICCISKNKYGEALYHDEKSCKNMKKELNEQLKLAVDKMFDDFKMNRLENKAINSLKRIQKEHNPKAYDDAMYNIYMKGKKVE